jgi:two-component system chemotaxis sensor kinase CheA
MTLDLKQFQGIFFEESFEGLDAMESALVAAAGPILDTDVINALFRAAHSMKGGSGTFGYADLTRFTHRMEALLDQVRQGSRPLDETLIAVLLQAVDAARDLLKVLSAGGQPGPEYLAAAEVAMDALLDPTSPPTNTGGQAAGSPAPRGDLSPPLPVSTQPGGGPGSRASPGPATRPPAAAVPASPPAPEFAAPGAAPAVTGWHIRFHPGRNLLAKGNDVVLIFRELARLGPLVARAEIDDLPTLAEMVPEDCYLAWSLDLAAPIPEAQVREVFDWVVDACDLELIPSPAGNPPILEAGPAAAPGAALFPAAPGAPSAPAVQVPPTPSPAETPPASPTVTSAEPAPPPAMAMTAPAPAGTSIRVGTEKVDALVNLVGELVITQSMLQRLASQTEGPAGEALRQGMIQLERNTRELQSQVLGIRMLPIGFVFNRFPRLIHDLARELGKQVEFHLGGEQTELDKRLIELVVDPLTHLLRNAMDHGLETPETRLARGKPATGNLRLSASHRAGSIFIEVADDGAGIDGPAVAARARELGLASHAESLDPEHLLRILCHPGLSTRTRVTALSGRGVGLDVVERNIRALGGRLELASTAGQGTRFTIRIPLTLAILDGQLIRVGPEIYILPLVSIVETVQLQPARVRVLPGGLEVYHLRERYLPVVRLAALLGVAPDAGPEARPLLVIVEVDDGDIALLVDELQGQQQIVIKGLEANFRKVPGVSAATVLGDGRVGLILDGAELKRIAGAAGHASPRPPTPACP